MSQPATSIPPLENADRATCHDVEYRCNPKQLSWFEWVEEQVTGSPESAIMARSVLW